MNADFGGQRLAGVEDATVYCRKFFVEDRALVDDVRTYVHHLLRVGEQK